MQHATVPDPTAPGMSPVWFVLGIWALYALMAYVAIRCMP